MTYPPKNLEFFSSLDGMQALCAEKVFAKNSPSQALPRQLPRRGSQAVKHIAKVFCVMGKFLTQAQSLRARQRLPRRGSWQNRQVLTEGVRQIKTFPPRRRFRRKQRGSCRLPLRPLPVKMQCRSVRRRSGIALLKIFFPLNMRKAHAERIQNRPARSANAYSVSTRSNRSFAASTASLLPKATRTPPDSTSDRAAACALSRAASTLHSALRSAASISSVMPQKYR